MKGSASLRETLGWAATGVGVLLVANAFLKEVLKFKIQNKVILITGSSRGLGFVLAQHLAKKGAKLAICARSADQLELARQQLEAMGAEVIARTVDVTQQGEVRTLIHDVVNHYGHIDALINNAGIVQVGPQEHMDIAEYEEAMKANFWAPLYAIKAIVPHFIQRRQGRILNITSIGGKIAIPHLLPYTASKFAAVGLSEGMHAELKKYDIDVITVVPNLMRTGSPPNITVKGDHQKEYAWFKIADASPLLSQDADYATKNIIKALEYGESEAVLSLTGKIATIVNGLAPGWVSGLMTLANKLLPPAATGGEKSLKGYEAESPLSQGTVASLSDRQSLKNNEL